MTVLRNSTIHNIQIPVNVGLLLIIIHHFKVKILFEIVAVCPGMHTVESQSLQL